MRLQTSLRIGAIIALTGLLAACGSNPYVPGTHAAPTNNLASEFTSEFATIFDASSTSEPATPDSNAVPALMLASQPVANPASS